MYGKNESVNIDNAIFISQLKEILYTLIVVLQTILKILQRKKLNLLSIIYQLAISKKSWL